LGEYDNAIESYKKVIKLNPENNNAYSNLFELLLIENKEFIEYEDIYIKLFKNNKKVFLKYEMLKILQNIANKKEVNLDEYFVRYKEFTLDDWSFDELEEWTNTKDEDIKIKLLDAIKRFKTKLKV